MEFTADQIIFMSGLVSALTGAIGVMGFMPKKYLPLLAIAFGVAVAVGEAVRLDWALSSDNAWAEIIIVGVWPVGLGAVGLYSGAKNLAEGVRASANGNKNKGTEPPPP